MSGNIMLADILKNKCIVRILQFSTNTEFALIYTYVYENIYGK